MSRLPKNHLGLIPVYFSGGFVSPDRIPENVTCTVCIWQANIRKTIIAHVPITDGEVQETGDFELDGVTFPAAEIKVEFMDRADGEGAMFPTGTLVNLAAGGENRTEVVFGHPSGTLKVGAEAEQTDGSWTAKKAIMSRSARVLGGVGETTPGLMPRSPLE